MEIEQPYRDQTHPNPPPSNHRKIELQSPLDLTYLQDNLAKVALEKLNFVLPDNPSKPPATATVITLPGRSNQETPETSHEPCEIEDDPLKQQVRDLISEFLQRTWQSAQQNLTLNGLDASTNPVAHTATLSSANTTSTQTLPAENKQPLETEGVHFAYTPFDSRLQHKLASLHGELEKLTAEVSKLRREAPQKSAATYSAALNSHISQDDESHANQEKRDQEQAQKSSQELTLTLTLTPVRDGWSDDLKEKYTGGVQELGGLAGVTGSNGRSGEKPSLTETMGKAIRARDVVHEME